jgi:hypothetical protein
MLVSDNFFANMKNKIEKYLKEKFQKDGFIPLPVYSITGELNISKKTLYKEYGSKHELVDITLTNMLIEAYNKVITTIAEKSPFIVKFYSIFDIVKKNLRAFDDESLFKLKKAYPDIWLKVARFRKYNIMPLLRLLITSGIKKGVINKYPVELYLKLIYGAIKETNRRDNKILASELDLLLKMLLNGALTKKGRKFLNNKLGNVN